MTVLEQLERVAETERLSLMEEYRSLLADPSNSGERLLAVARELGRVPYQVARDQKFLAAVAKARIDVLKMPEAEAEHARLDRAMEKAEVAKARAEETYDKARWALQAYHPPAVKAREFLKHVDARAYLTALDCIGGAQEIMASATFATCKDLGCSDYRQQGVCHIGRSPADCDDARRKTVQLYIDEMIGGTD